MNVRKTTVPALGLDIVRTHILRWARTSLHIYMFVADWIRILCHCDHDYTNRRPRQRIRGSREFLCWNSSDVSRRSERIKQKLPQALDTYARNFVPLRGIFPNLDCRYVSLADPSEVLEGDCLDHSFYNSCALC